MSSWDAVPELEGRALAARRSNIVQSNLRAVLRQILTTNHSPNFIAEQRGMSHNTVRNWRRILEEKEITSTQLDLGRVDEFSRAENSLFPS